MPTLDAIIAIKTTTLRELETFQADLEYVDAAVALMIANMRLLQPRCSDSEVLIQAKLFERVGGPGGRSIPVWRRTYSVKDGLLEVQEGLNLRQPRVDVGREGRGARWADEM